MGVPSPGQPDLAVRFEQGAFTVTGAGAGVMVQRDFNLSIWGTFTATVALERSFDNGTTWLNASRDVAGTPNSITAPMSVVCNEPENGVLYRLNCTAISAGTVNWRISQ